ncbi:MAG: hypothetical protein JST86_20585 [Bacteroidetes bacterium]|nr:hypothetical protein [Bacteroidota bacterium]
MKKLILSVIATSIITVCFAQQTKTSLYALLKQLITDSTGYENVGDWSVGGAKNKIIKWANDRVEMSEDTSINFFRRATVDITIKGKTLQQAGQPVKWNLLLKGPRAGYTSFSMISSPCSELKPIFTIDSVMEKMPYSYKLLKSCNAKAVAGYYYYELKLPKKDVAYVKLSWLSLNGNTAMRIDCYSSFSKYAAKLDCK